MIHLDMRTEQTIKLNITPEMRQALSLLNYSTTDLVGFIENEALENPLLELETNDYDQNLATNDVTDGAGALDFVQSEGDHLYDYLHEQVIHLHLNEQQQKMINYIILMLDDNGYFKEPFDDVAEQLQVTVEQVEQAVRTIQQLEPAGIAATSLQECLYIQIARNDPDNLVAQQIVLDHLEALSSGQFDVIAEILNITEGKVKQVLTSIQSLNPKPANALDPPTERDYVTPDLFVYVETNDITVAINDQLIPNVQLSDDYLPLLKGEVDQETSQFLREKYKRLKWLQRTIAHRHLTLQQVMQAIAAHQSDFFYKGPSHLQPLTLKQIANECQLHVSTISRATTSKYVQTPFGLYELKYFFTSSIPLANGKATSSNKIKHLIAKLIEQEDKNVPLSDQKIANILKEQDILISRRTVAKYRNQLKIPSTKLRKGRTKINASAT
ncbi:RNA polymerase factor sigma-54 [Aquibacillus sediminis]|uniref:RNA polymerase factor sigma-54 n=1 Tax=Aquibacillus sediminis TaxID=2574734 RepID=UPI0011083505|nr:RNA polymerase factor sigma-54 [Aquibacillus sediminis]